MTAGARSLSTLDPTRAGPLTGHDGEALLTLRFLDADRDDALDASEWPKLAEWLNGFEHRNALVAIAPGAGPRKGEAAVLATPALADGHVYVRTAGRLSVFGE